MSQGRRARIVPLLSLVLICIGCSASVQPQGPTGQGVSQTTQSPTGSTGSASTPRASVSNTGGSPAFRANPGGLSDELMVGQLFMAYVYGSSATDATASQRNANLALYGAATGAEVVRRWHLGGVILLDHNNLDPTRPDLSTGNVINAPQISTLTSGLQRAAVSDSGIRLLIATDQEGGRVQRIINGVASRPAQERMAEQSENQLRCGYFSLGRELRQLGVNQDFAPVADVVRTATGVIGDRSFGPDPTLDARDVVAAVTGLQQAGVLATLKHWPGHGSTSTDSHLALAVIRESVAKWKAVDRPPFQAGAAVAASVMVGHLAFPALDSSGTPATLSPRLVNVALRRDLGYQGLVVTDSLWMAPVRKSGTPGHIARLAIVAGDDMLLMSPDVPAAYKEVFSLIRADPKIRTSVQASVRRILAAKAILNERRLIPDGC
jgi:beta-N-acetylhexosaminidase